MNILMSVNKDFLEYAEDMMFSLLYYSSEELYIYLMYQEKELGQKEIKHIQQFVENTQKGKIIPIKFDSKLLEGMPITDDEGAFFGVEAYSRLFCAFKLPKEVKKILYIDADMICTGDIKELYDIEFDGKTWVACQDIGIQEKDLQRLNLPKKYPYINTGMLLINTEKLRENYTEEKIVKLIKENRQYLIYPDQDFINKIFKDDIRIIDSKYNLLAKSVRYKDLKTEPLIIHYAGSIKPWHDNVSRFDKEYMEPYYKALKLQGKLKEEKLIKLINKHKETGYNN